MHIESDYSRLCDLFLTPKTLDFITMLTPSGTVTYQAKDEQPDAPLSPVFGLTVSTQIAADDQEKAQAVRQLLADLQAGFMLTPPRQGGEPSGTPYTDPCTDDWEISIEFSLVEPQGEFDVIFVVRAPILVWPPESRNPGAIVKYNASGALSPGQRHTYWAQGSNVSGELTCTGGTLHLWPEDIYMGNGAHRTVTDSKITIADRDKRRDCSYQLIGRYGSNH
jgi:hypothetical protein